jgi:hypothetical protein
MAAAAAWRLGDGSSLEARTSGAFSGEARAVVVSSSPDQRGGAFSGKMTT